MNDEMMDRIDYLVATKVLGLQGCDDPACEGCDAGVVLLHGGCCRGLTRKPFQPTRDWAAMGEVIEKMKSDGWSLEGIEWMQRLEHGRIVCEFGIDDHAKIKPQHRRGRADAPTMPLAVSLASLKAVGVDVREFEEKDATPA